MMDAWNKGFPSHPPHPRCKHINRGNRAAVPQTPPSMRVVYLLAHGIMTHIVLKHPIIRLEEGQDTAVNTTSLA